MLGDAQILSLEKMVCDNHLLHQLETVICPVIINDETLQVDLIRSVGIGGSYLTQKKTRDYTRKGYVRMWPPAGKTMLEIARAEAFEILHEHQPPPLPPGAEKRLEEIIASADKDLS